MVCYRCKNNISNYTYLIYVDSNKPGNFESVMFPWDKHRLLKNQGIEHSFMEDIEFFGINYLGDIPEIDKSVSDIYNTIKIDWSKTQGRHYAMNHCKHCGAKQGEFFMLQQIDKYIKNKEPVKIDKEINILF